MRFQHRNKDRLYIDQMWLDLLLAMISDTIDQDPPSSGDESDDDVQYSLDDVCGCLMSRRKGGDRLAIWNGGRFVKDEVLKLVRIFSYALCSCVYHIPALLFPPPSLCFLVFKCLAHHTILFNTG